MADIDRDFPDRKRDERVYSVGGGSTTAWWIAGLLALAVLIIGFIAFSGGNPAPVEDTGTAPVTETAPMTEAAPEEGAAAPAETPAPAAPADEPAPAAPAETAPAADGGAAAPAEEAAPAQ